MRGALIIITAAAIGLTACQDGKLARHDRHGRHGRYDPNRGRPEIPEGNPVLVQDAKREAQRRCGPMTTHRRRGTDGTSTADYDCQGTRK